LGRLKAAGLNPNSNLVAPRRNTHEIPTSLSNFFGDCLENKSSLICAPLGEVFKVSRRLSRHSFVCGWSWMGVHRWATAVNVKLRCLPGKAGGLPVMLAAASPTPLHAFDIVEEAREAAARAVWPDQAHMQARPTSSSLCCAFRVSMRKRPYATRINRQSSEEAGAELAVIVDRANRERPMLLAVDEFQYGIRRRTPSESSRKRAPSSTTIRRVFTLGP